MYIHCLQNAGKYQKELCIFMRCLTWLKKIDSIVCCNGPVIMLTGTVYSCKWFLMKQALHSMLACNSLQRLHCELVLIYCNICFGIDRSKLVLCRSNFIMLCLCCNADFPQLDIYISHERCDPLTDRSKVMIIQFLSLRRHCTEKGTSCIDQVFSLFKLLCIYEEVLLLSSNRRSYFLRCCVSK